MREEGYKVGVIRPITLWPFPVKAYKEAKNAKAFLSVEMSMGQMVEDIKLATEGKAPVYFFGRKSQRKLNNVPYICIQCVGCGKDGYIKD